MLSTHAARPALGNPAARTRLARDTAIAARRAEGLTLEAIAHEFGMTRERVRQIVAERGGADLAEVRRVRAAHGERARQSLRDRCLEHLASHAGMTLEALATAVGARPGDVRSALGSDARRLLAARPQRPRQRVSDEELLGELRLAAGLIRGPLTGSAYDRIARGLGLHSRMHLIHRFGTWIGACERAGVTPGQPRRAAYQRAWTAVEMAAWVARYLRQPDSRGTFGGYSEFARRTSGAPSGETVRVTIGPWSVVKAEALRLGATADADSRPSDLTAPLDDERLDTLDWDDIEWADLEIHGRAVPRRVHAVML
jgi:AraC-like DNA-binding protein